MVIKMGEELRQAVDPMQLMQRVADESLELIGDAAGVLIGMVDGPDDLLVVCGTGLFQHWVGLRIPIDGSMSGLSVRERTVHVSSDTSEDPRVNAEVCRRVGAVSLVTVPICHAAHCVGVMTITSPRPGAFGEHDAEVLAELAEFVGAAVRASAELAVSARRLLERPPGGGTSTEEAEKMEAFVANVLSPTASHRREERMAVEEILEERRLTMAFQPVVDLRSGGIFGVEALARFSVEPYRPPDHWFAIARHVGVGLELEMLAIELALDRLVDLAPGVRLAVNASPETVTSAALLEVLGKVAEPERVIVEVTEHVHVDDYRTLDAALDRLRLLGVSVAVDDAGAGISSLSHILRLRPELIKLDRELVTGVDRDPARRSLVGSMVVFASETGAGIVAEGIESLSERDVLRDLGITFGQGFVLYMPCTFAELPAEILA